MKVAAVVLNWRGWPDTVECLESVYRTHPAPTMVVVCDNDSGDESVERIREWAAGRLDATPDDSGPLRQLTAPPVPKPIRVIEPASAGSPVHASDGLDGPHPAGAPEPAPPSRDVPGDQPAPPLVLVETGSNLGYAGGNNVAIRHALADPEIDAVWILNNDTVVDPGALGALVGEIERSPDVGICGSTLLYYDRPAVVQTLGGAKYSPWTALPRHIGEGEPLVRAPAPDEVRRTMWYVNGASMLVTRRFVEEVGLMDERYFLYFEELDWALRARGRFSLGFAPGSVVFHKEGSSIGTDGAERKSELSDRWFHRNRLEITRRYFPRRMWTVRLALLVSVLRRLRRREWSRARMLVELARSG